MTVTVSQMKAECFDREAIRDCLYRYARGIDRVDEALLRSAFWPDATDEHAGMFSGSMEEIIANLMRDLPTFGDTAHHIGNIVIRIDGDSAAVESYVHAIHRIPVEGEMRDMIGHGRYIDRFERRGDEWRIAARVVVIDTYRDYPDTCDWTVGPFGLGDSARSTKDRTDKSYSWLGIA